MTELPGSILPSRSAASIIATPIRSFTDPPGFMYSSFTKTSDSRTSVRRRRATIGVLPIVTETSRAMAAFFSEGEGIRCNTSGEGRQIWLVYGGLGGSWEALRETHATQK